MDYTDLLYYSLWMQSQLLTLTSKLDIRHANLVSVVVLDIIQNCVKFLFNKKNEATCRPPIDAKGARILGAPLPSSSLFGPLASASGRPEKGQPVNSP